MIPKSGYRVSLALVVFVGLLHAHAGDYPTHAVKIIVPYPAGGSADALPRIVGDWLISEDAAAALRDPAVIARLAALSAEPVGTDPAATAAFIGEEIGRWDKVIKTAGIKIE